MEFLNEIQKYYTEKTSLVSSPFANLSCINTELFNKVFMKLRITIDNKKILDIGCGGGLFSQYCHQKKAKYVGLDLTFKNISVASAKYSGSFIQANAQQLPFKLNSFDLITVIDSFEHFPDPYQAVAEFRRTLGNGGSVFLSVPNYLNIAGLVKIILEKFHGYQANTWAPFDFWEPQVYEHFLTPIKIKKIFENAGFSQFKMISHVNNYYVGLFPWVWHKKCPHILERGIYYTQLPFQNILAKFLPWFGLHNFWKISI